MNFAEKTLNNLLRNKAIEKDAFSMIRIINDRISNKKDGIAFEFNEEIEVEFEKG